MCTSTEISYLKIDILSSSFREMGTKLIPGNVPDIVFFYLAEVWNYYMLTYVYIWPLYIILIN